MKKCKIPRSFDIIGSREKAVAILKVDNSENKKSIAENLMKIHKNVKTVLEKASPRKGEFRTREYEIIKGEKNTEVKHKESGCLFLVDPQKVYFSPRESTERLRIASMVKRNETVMVFFAGVGPFNIIIGKKAKPKRLIGIEINPVAVKYFKENIRINKVDNCVVVFGDVKDKARQYYRKCDRVLMPLPEKGYEYLEYAIKCLKKNGICHFYCFSKDGKGWIKKIIEICEKQKREPKILSIKKVLPYGPRIWKIRIDFEVR